MQIGRAEIFTDEREINESNILRVLQNAYAEHTANTNRIEYLLEYEAGNQPLDREKKIRSEIDIQSVDNVAHEITEFNLGFKWGNPITIVQRGEKDSGNTEETLGISLLNECYSAEDIKSKTQKLGRFVEIGGIGYTYIDVKSEWEEGDSYFSVEVLDPRWAFVVRSSRYIDHRIVLGVTYTTTKDGVNHYTCFTKDTRYDINSFEEIDKESGEEIIKWEFNSDKNGKMIYKNILGAIPIVEWIRAHDRMGCFERFLDELNTLNLMISDFSNDVEQNTQALLHANDIDFKRDENGNIVTPKSGDMIMTQTLPDGKTPFVKSVTTDYDYTGMLNNIAMRRAWILEKANVPMRNENTNGATGVAMGDATGWSSAENSASKQQGIMECSKMDEIKLILRAIKKSPDIKSDNPLLKLRYIDVEPNVKRMKTYEMVTKANAFATYVSHGVYGLHALQAINAFGDVNQVWEDSKEMIEKYQKSLFEKSNESVGGMDEQAPNKDRLQGDESDQIDNSPTIDKE